ncbi:GAF domain-containing sensor histidine kinase [Oceanobacillus damuensis]|uniref:GAF domain-containing sensor histidine kinase n=1 Tax=Oceanobacillus damuensis TaxID=937928 RepID=UPI00082F153F|nr:GAF domain-containing sensor histidine kinase [Oceanobacillus damuensis]
MHRKETNAKLFMTLVSTIGFMLVTMHLFQLQPLEDPIILLLFAVFLAVCDYYSIPVWKGNTTINFPIVFIVYLVYGLSYTIVVYALVVLAVNIINRRPIRILFFNPAQLVLSFYAAVQLTDLLSPYIMLKSTIMDRFMEYVILLFLFHIFNNLIVDIVLYLRPQLYSFQAWKQKTLSELSSGIISLVYGFMLFSLGSQNRGEIDFFSFFFFYSPLVGLSLLSAVISRLRKEKNRLKALFTVTSELNTMVPTEDFLEGLQTSFPDFIDADAEALWIKEGDIWNLHYMQGDIHKERILSKEIDQLFETITSPIVINNRKEDIGIASLCFGNNLKSFVYAPLIIEKELIGMFIFARSRTKSFVEEDDIRSIATFANQLAIVLKTRALIQEKEKRLILEERNRIAREIHDGVAQSLAGAVMSLETAERKFRINPEETLHIVSSSILKLRESLKEVRESIYALRPYPTERVGLIAALRKKINDVMEEYGVLVHFEIHGKEEELSTMMERVLFDVFQESIANSIKHSGTASVDVLLSYQSEQIVLRVKDYGIGFSLFHEMIKAKDTSHFGILNMNESIETINGSLQIDSKEGEGTKVSVMIPKIGLGGEDRHDKCHDSR